jgi:hypothetical protein
MWSSMQVSFQWEHSQKSEFTLPKADSVHFIQE